jgi:hypothetical protein
MRSAYSVMHADDASAEDLRNWCDSHLGPGTHARGIGRWWFFTREDAVMFYLAWGSHGENVDGDS